VKALVNELKDFVVEGGRGFYRPVGSVSFEQAATMVRAAVAAAHTNHIRELLVDTTALIGFPSPDTLQRFLAAVEWAAAGRSDVILAMVARAEMIDPDRFGVIVARNRGLTSNIFTTEQEARAWLDAPHHE
jgi:hypothetical protein